MSGLDKEVKNANKHFFNRIAQSYDSANLRSHRWMDFNMGKMFERINGGRKLESHLDLCCGTGVVSGCGGKYFNHSYGIDISLNMLKVASRYSRAVCCDAALLSFRSNTFDVVSCCGGLHHIYDFRGVFREVFRVLKTGGVFYIDHEINRSFLKRYILPINFYRIFFGVEKKYLRLNKDMNVEQFKLAEYHTYYEPGLDTCEVKEMLSDIGFRDIEVYNHCVGVSVVTNYIISLFRIERFPKNLSPFFAVLARK